MPVVVSNASPLILLSQIGAFDRLQDLFGQITITPQVFDEVVVHGRGKPGASEVNQAGFIHRRGVTGISRIAEIQHQLHVGEGITNDASMDFRHSLSQARLRLAFPACRKASQGSGQRNQESGTER